MIEARPVRWGVRKRACSVWQSRL